MKPEPLIAAFCALAIAAHFLIPSPLYSPLPLLAALLIGGTPLILTLLRKALKGEFGADFLAGISIITSVILGEYLAGTVIVLMLSGGESLEGYAMRRASSVLNALAKRMPRVAHRHSAAGIEDIPLDQVTLGDLLIVLPHESCPVDGTVTEGHGSMDESYLTGEPWQIDKIPGATVLSGALNGPAALTIRVDQLPIDSRYAKIVRVMQQAELNRPRFRRVADRLGAWYTVLAVSVALAGWWLGHDPSRFLAVLVIATPCPLLLAIPIAIVGAISVAASRAIIIKDPAMLERIDSCRTMIFDKTGTLTYGRPLLTEIICEPAVLKPEALRLAASIEQYSKHPLAAAILDAARAEKLTLAPVDGISEIPGSGLTGLIAGVSVQIKGSPDGSVLLLDGRLAATFRFRDAPRDESKSFISHLAPRHGVNRVILLSGDREEPVLHLAGQVGITEALFSQSPEEKVAFVRHESALAPTMFLGDGINDAPAMQAATVGVAFGQNSDITAEAADAVILDPSLAKVDELIHIGRRMRRIALQSAIGGMALSMLGMLAAALGFLPPVAGAIAQEIIDIAAVLNALRVALPAKDLNSDLTAL